MENSSNQKFEATKPPYYYEIENNSNERKSEAINIAKHEKLNFHQINIGLIKIIVSTDDNAQMMLSKILGCKINTDNPNVHKLFLDYYDENQFAKYIFQISRITGRENTYKEFKVYPTTNLFFEIPPRYKYKIFIYPFSIEWKQPLNSEAKIHGDNIIIPRGIYKLNSEIEGWCCWQGLAHFYYEKISINDSEERKKEIAKEVISERPEEFKKAVEWMNKVSVLKNLWEEKK